MNVTKAQGLEIFKAILVSKNAIFSHSQTDEERTISVGEYGVCEVLDKWPDGHASVNWFVIKKGGLGLFSLKADRDIKIIFDQRVRELTQGQPNKHTFESVMQELRDLDR